MPAYSGEFPFAPEAGTMKKCPRRREIRHIRRPERTILIFMEPMGREKNLKKQGIYPESRGWKISAYHKHFKRLIGNLGEE
jgi:hypothetical protein